MFSAGLGMSDELQRILLAAAIRSSMHHRTSPSAIVVNSSAFGGDTLGGVGGPVMLMSIPGIGLVGTGLPGVGAAEHVGLGPATPVNFEDRLPDALRSMLQTMRMAMEASVQESQQPASRTPPASELVRDALPRVLVTKEDQVDSNNSKCAVCLEDYCIGQRATRMFCGHLFCTTCIREWLRQANSCPICRFELATDEADFEAARIERMRSRRIVLKDGDLRLMRVPDLKKLMRALCIQGEGCIEKNDLIKCLADAACTEVLPDQNVCYEVSDLDNLDIVALRTLMEWHSMPKIPDDLDEAKERNAAMDSFRSLGKLIEDGSKGDRADLDEPSSKDGDMLVGCSTAVSPQLDNADVVQAASSAALPEAPARRVGRAAPRRQLPQSPPAASSGSIVAGGAAASRRPEAPGTSRTAPARSSSRSERSVPRTSDQLSIAGPNRGRHHRGASSGR
eukprot:SRR837773.12248.p1 GENE.SRR837773.12248~~SRR837773.12248.p1  ORF type:complete len:451 (+),score=23.43 SRR837773.12248:33-1385(+)